ncbi:MAG: hypothetical protein AAF242_01600 [Bacteroidota bacterium]
MLKTLSIPRSLLTLGLIGSLLVFLVFLMQSPLIRTSANLDLAVSVDLLLTIPLLYFLLIRKTDIPKITLVPITIVGLLLGYNFLPLEHQMYLDLFKEWVLPLIELTVLSVIITKVIVGIKKYRSVSGERADFYSTLIETCEEVLPKKMVHLFATEIAVFYYSFFTWKKRPVQENEFTYHLKSGTPVLLLAFIFIILIETFVLHLIIERWSVTAAWILTILSIYTGLQMLGFSKSLSRRPYQIKEGFLHLRYGILSEAIIPLQEIERIEITKKALPEDKMARRLSPLGDLESHNLVLHFKTPQVMVGLYGFKKTFNTLALFVDDPQPFKHKVEHFY